MSKPKIKVELDHAVPKPGGCADNLWAMIAIDADGNESVCGREVRGVMVPMMTFTFETVEKFRRLGLAMRQTRPDIRVVIRQYSNATDIDEL